MIQKQVNSVLIKKRNSEDMLHRDLQLWLLSVRMDSMFFQAIRMVKFGIHYNNNNNNINNNICFKDLGLENY